jgi:alkylation response protein AidB-like acyl-CoA dehydrogenase
MNYDESEQITLLRDTVKRFVEQELPREEARRLDREASFSKERFAKLCQLGVTGVTIPEKYGGSGVDIVAAIAIIEELARRGSSLAGPFIHCAFYGGMNLVENGSEEQKHHYLPQLARGEILFAYGLSEPDVGGDLASATVTARRSGDSVIINGTKRWCTGARDADFIYTLVRSDDESKRYKNLSFVIVPRDAQGVSIVDIDHLGLRYAATTDVIFDDVEVPFDNVMGGPDGWNRGWPMLAGRALDVEKLEITAVQAVRHALVEARTKYEACRHMLYHAAWLAGEGRDCSVESSMAKLFVADTGVDVVLTCQRVMGAYGCASEYDMERYVRDIVNMPIVGGSSNMQKNNIANRLGLAVR